MEKIDNNFNVLGLIIYINQDICNLKIDYLLNFNSGFFHVSEHISKNVNIEQLRFHNYEHLNFLDVFFPCNIFIISFILFKTLISTQNLVITLDEISKFTQIQKKAFHSILIDGMNELFLGIILLLAGLMIYLLNWLTVIIIILYLLLLFKKKTIFQKLRVKYIYPRMGYVKFKDDHNKKLKKYHILLLIIAIICNVLFLSLLFIDGYSIETMFKNLPIIMGSALLAKSSFVYIFTGKKYYLGFGILSFILAIIFIYIPLPFYRNHVVYYAWTVSIMLFLLGGSRLYLFLRKNPLITEIENI